MRHRTQPIQHYDHSRAVTVGKAGSAGWEAPCRITMWRSNGEEVFDIVNGKPSGCALFHAAPEFALSQGVTTANWVGEAHAALPRGAAMEIEIWQLVK